MSALRQTYIARLSAVALSLALMVASIVGGAAHAREHGHHSHHHHGAAPVSAHVGHGTPHAPVGGSHLDFQSVADDEPDSAPHRAGCLDFVCHGGAAVLGAANPWIVAPWPAAAIFPWQTRALIFVSPARLDRPPKSLVSA